jgi:hypothetical protein
VFFEVFLVQIRRKLWKIHFEVRLQGKKNFRKRVSKFKTRGKNGNPGEKESCGMGRENFVSIVVNNNNQKQKKKKKKKKENGFS